MMVGYPAAGAVFAFRRGGAVLVGGPTAETPAFHREVDSGSPSGGGVAAGSMPSTTVARTVSRGYHGGVLPRSSWVIGPSSPVV